MQSFFSLRKKIISIQKVLSPVDRNIGQFPECSQNTVNLAPCNWYLHLRPEMEPCYQELRKTLIFARMMQLFPGRPVIRSPGESIHFVKLPRKCWCSSGLETWVWLPLPLKLSPWSYKVSKKYSDPKIFLQKQPQGLTLLLRYTKGPWKKHPWEEYFSLTETE